ncbi:MAG: electron transport complex subunit E [Clostridia bacterium]|nr:electron transport complex subunit E [Clostridia bacterium]
MKHLICLWKLWRRRKRKVLKTIKNGLINENPTFVQVLGMCPTLAVTTSLINGIGMGLSVTFVLILSNMLISMLRRIIPSKIRIAAYVVIIATFVTVVDLVLKAYVPSLSQSLGLFIPLIVVNCIILARAEAFASKNTVLKSAADGLGMGLGFTVALSLISAVREILGNGTILGMSVGIANPATVMILPPGGFLTLGIILGIINAIRNRKEQR